MNIRSQQRWLIPSIVMVSLAGAVALSSALAQPRQGSGPGGQGGDYHDRQPGPPPPPDGMGGGPGGGPGRGPGGGQGGGPGGGPGGMESGPIFRIHMLRELVGLIGDYQKIAESPSASGVAAVLSVNEHYRDPHTAAAFLEKMLPNAKDATVARAIRIQLADFYKRTDQHDKAAEQLEQLITGK